MGKEEQLNLSNKLIVGIIVHLSLAACATNAPELPPDYSSVHSQQRVSIDEFDTVTANLTCEQIRSELEELNSEHATKTHEISEKRGSNQTIGYIGSVFFLPIVLASDSNVQAKEKITNIHRAKDKLYKLQSLKKCPSKAT